ncbi:MULTISPECIES: hypothetical protein [Burkholderia]|uniref:Uncharacterized protein n=1 Tax=Burkholderia paludis TaxID=1506587 RepID=A0A6P2SLS4_9BURK|nr:MULTISPECIES: hypothetical protein [Burkholderia]CAB3768870.1 hypothetical protein LMG30113_05814 [Burkholderia paludis]VWC44862.1 hypothetical protein BPA30113_07213 [Burkholderia paludis]
MTIRLTTGRATHGWSRAARREKGARGTVGGRLRRHGAGRAFSAFAGMWGAMTMRLTQPTRRPAIPAVRRFARRRVGCLQQASLPYRGPLREWFDAAVKRKAIETEPNGNPNDSAPVGPKTAKPLFVL